MSVKPVAPDEIVKVIAEKSIIPDEVIESFNELIARSWDGRKATVSQSAAINLIKSKNPALADGIFSKGYLNIEEIYRQQGWHVWYDKPGFNETYDAYFEFTRPETRRESWKG